MCIDLFTAFSAAKSISIHIFLTHVITGLQTVIQAADAVKTSARISAAVQLKNCIKKFWTKSPTATAGSFALSTEDKAGLRANILSAAVLHEPSDNIADVLGVAFSIMVRADYPNEWPDVVHATCKAVEAAPPGSRARSRATLFLHRAIKALHSKRMPKHVQAFKSCAADIRPWAFELWSAHVQGMVLQLLSDGTPADFVSRAEAALEQLRQARWIAKAVHRLVCEAGAADVGSPPVLHFLQAAASLLAGVMQCLAQLRGMADLSDTSVAGHEALQLVRGIALRSLRTLARAQARNPTHVLPVLTHVLDAVWDAQQRVCAAQSMYGPPSELVPFVLHGAKLLSDVVSCSLYSASAMASVPAELQAHVPSLNAWFHGQRVADMVDVYAVRASMMSEEDVERWQSDGEEFVAIAEAATTDNSARAAADNVLMALADHDVFVETAVARLVALAEECPSLLASVAAAPSSAHSLGAALQAEAVWHAMGALSYVMLPRLSFQSWCASCLVPALRWHTDVGKVWATGQAAPAVAVQSAGAASAAQRILLAAAGWTISCWRSALPAASRAELVSPLVACLLAPDAPLRYSAAQALHVLLSDEDMDSRPLQAAVGEFAQQVFVAVMASEASALRNDLLSLLLAVVEKTPPAQIQASAAAMLSGVPALWDALEEQNVVRQPLLELLAGIVQAVRSAASELYPLLIPIIKLCTDASRPEMLYLGETACELWLALVDHAPQYNEHLHSLWPQVVPLVRAQASIAKVAMALLTSYIHVGAAAWLSAPGVFENVGALLLEVLGVYDSQTTVTACTASEQLLMQTAANSLAVGPVFSGLTAVLQRCMLGVMDSDESTRSRVAYGSVLARAVSWHAATFWEVVAQFEREQLAAVLAGKTEQLPYASSPLSPQRGKQAGLAVSRAPDASHIAHVMLRVSVLGGQVAVVLPACMDGQGVAGLAACADAWLELWDSIHSAAGGDQRRLLWVNALCASLPALARALPAMQSSHPEEAGRWRHDFAQRLEAVAAMSQDLPEEMSPSATPHASSGGRMSRLARAAHGSGLLNDDVPKSRGAELRAALRAAAAASQSSAVAALQTCIAECQQAAGPTIWQDILERVDHAVFRAAGRA